MRSFLAASLMLATSMLSPATGQEVGKCAPDDIVAKDLDKAKQTLATIGFIDSSALYAVYASQGGANWTAVVIRSDRFSCVVARGTDLQRVVIEPRGEKV